MSRSARDTSIPGPPTVITGWGRYPTLEARTVSPVWSAEAVELAMTIDGYLPRGAGRSYGDCALSATLLSTGRLDRFVSFDHERGVITCESGVTLGSLAELAVEHGWFPPVVPGTRHVTIGGAVASDVHGKNHRLRGSFCDHVRSLTVATPAEGLVRCSPEVHRDLFRATCGGMGLTGTILQIELELMPVAGPGIAQRTVVADGISELVEQLDVGASTSHTVAWIDLAGRRPSTMRSILTIGDHTLDRVEVEPPRAVVSVPFPVPSLLDRGPVVRTLNRLQRMASTRQADRSAVVHYESFFFPLDRIGEWNRLYGSSGFLQYQFAIPSAAGVAGLEAILGRASTIDPPCTLAVLKALGPRNNNLLSFPIEGYTAALDFARHPDVLTALDDLDELVADVGGRVYLAKDARQSSAMFERTYPGRQEFETIRDRYDPQRRIRSVQGERLGL